MNERIDVKLDDLLPQSSADELTPAFDDVWYIAARSRDVRRDPVARSIVGRNLVLFRGEDDRVAALEDRCLHRHVALSGGRVDGGKIECPYHGWQFAPDGACVSLPCAAPSESLPKRKVRTYSVLEREGSIWVCVGDTPPAAPPTWRLPGEPENAAWFETQIVMETPLRWVLENFVDCGHTGFVHAGLFRGKPQRVVQATAEDTKAGVKIETFGESDPSSILGRLFVPKGETMTHTDEIVLPNVVRVRYAFGPRTATTISVCTPETATRTRVFTRVYVDMPPASWAVAALVYPMTRKILLQDQVILENQGAQLRRYGTRFGASSAADTPTAFVARAFDEFGKGTFPAKRDRRRTFDYKL